MQGVAREIWPATTRHNGPHRLVSGGGNQGRRGAGARAEYPHRKALNGVVLAHSVERREDTVGEQADVEPEFAGSQIGLFLALGQQVQ